MPPKCEKCGAWLTHGVENHKCKPAMMDLTREDAESIVRDRAKFTLPENAAHVGGHLPYSDDAVRASLALLAHQPDQGATQNSVNESEGENLVVQAGNERPDGVPEFLYTNPDFTASGVVSIYARTEPKAGYVNRYRFDSLVPNPDREGNPK